MSEASRMWSLDVWKIGMVLRRSKIFIVTVTRIAVSSVGAAYIELLKRFNVPHDPRYIFQPVEPV